MSLTGTTRASLLARLTDASDQTAWEEFLTVYGPLVFSDLRRRGCSHEDSEDLLQRILTRVFRAFKSFDYDRTRGRFRDWLGTIVRHEVIRDYRTKSRRPTIMLSQLELCDVAGTADPEWTEAFHTQIYRVAIDRCRVKFEPRTWQIFEAVWMNGFSAADAAAMAGTDLNAVYLAKSRVLSALTTTIEELTDDLPFLSPST